MRPIYLLNLTNCCTKYKTIHFNKVICSEVDKRFGFSLLCMCNTFTIIISENVLSHVLIASSFLHAVLINDVASRIKATRSIVAHWPWLFRYARQGRCLSASRLLTFFCLVRILFKITGNQSITPGRLVLKRVIFVLFSMLQATCNVNNRRFKQIFTFTLIIKVPHRIKVKMAFDSHAWMSLVFEPCQTLGSHLSSWVNRTAMGLFCFSQLQFVSV